MSFDPRTEYQDVQTAQEYDAKRFRSLSGRLFQWAEWRALRAMLRRIPPGGLVLDSPCGTGRILCRLAEGGYRVIGADISAEMMAVARARLAANGHARFARMDLARIPLADRSVEAVLSIRFLPHFSPAERSAMLREFGRVARRAVILTVSLSTPWHRIRRRIKRALGHPRPVRHPVTDAELRAELAGAGLRELARASTVSGLSEQVIVLAEPVGRP
jgi:ubiquinone/menaquinone biosynthesis C-methylase UbiE